MTDEIQAKIEAHRLWLLGKPGGIKADLRGADLRGAHLIGARLNWRSHRLIAEILRPECGQDADKRSLAGLIAISEDWCFDQWIPLMQTHPLAGWAVETLRPWYRAGDEPAHQLRQIFGDPPPPKSNPEPTPGEPATEPQPEQAQ